MKLILVDYQDKGCIEYNKCGAIAVIDTSIIVNVDGQPIILAKFDDQQTTNSVYKKFIRDVEKIKKGEYYAYAYRFSKFFHKGKVVKFNKKVNDFTNKKEGIQ